jgi:hypothetical protein
MPCQQQHLSLLLGNQRPELVECFCGVGGLRRDALARCRHVLSLELHHVYCQIVPRLQQRPPASRPAPSRCFGAPKQRLGRPALRPPPGA